MPALQPQVMGRDLDELEKQQQGDDEPLPFGGRHMENPSPGPEEGGEMVQQVEADAENDGDRKQPLLEKLNESMHGLRS